MDGIKEVTIIAILKVGILGSLAEKLKLVHLAIQILCFLLIIEIRDINFFGYYSRISQINRKLNITH